MSMIQKEDIEALIIGHTQSFITDLEMRSATDAAANGWGEH